MSTSDNSEHSRSYRITLFYGRNDSTTENFLFLNFILNKLTMVYLLVQLVKGHQVWLVYCFSGIIILQS